jgi:hypothetical protein
LYLLGTVANLTSLKSGRYYLGCAVQGNNFIVSGGLDNNNDVLNLVEKLDLR